MQKIYTVITSGYNGTVTVHLSASSFFSKELAEEACKLIDEVNEDAFLKVHSRVQESVIYESRNEVPVLNTPIEDLKVQVTTHEDFQKGRSKIVVSEEPFDLSKLKEVTDVSKRKKLGM